MQDSRLKNWKALNIPINQLGAPSDAPWCLLFTNFIKYFSSRIAGFFIHKSFFIVQKLPKLDSRKIKQFLKKRASHSGFVEVLNALKNEISKSGIVARWHPKSVRENTLFIGVGCVLNWIPLLLEFLFIFTFTIFKRNFALNIFFLAMDTSRWVNCPSSWRL